MGSIDLVCAWCGADLEVERSNSYYPTVDVIPCATCLKEARDEGYEEAQDAV